MKVYILRHGEAGYHASCDHERALTEYGVEQCQKVGQYLAKQGVSIDLAWVSPYKRAQQTYSVISECVSIKKMEIEQHLTPSGNPNLIIDQAKLEKGKIESLLLVSHLPMVSYLLEKLSPMSGASMFSTAEIVCVELTDDLLTNQPIWIYKP